MHTITQHCFPNLGSIRYIYSVLLSCLEMDAAIFLVRQRVCVWGSFDLGEIMRDSFLYCSNSANGQKHHRVRKALSAFLIYLSGNAARPLRLWGCIKLL